MALDLRARLATALFVAIAVTATGCSRADLDEDGARVTASPNPPSPNCAVVGHFVGEGGGSFGGGWISNDDLIEYAMNDLRNQAGRAGSNYVQHDPPTFGQGDGTTTTATISGTGYLCPG